MNVLILAAGYATRLYPLTLHKAKPLLVVGGKPIIEWVVDNLAGIPDLETIYVVANNKFAGDFQAWSERYQGRNSEFKFKIQIQNPNSESGFKIRIQIQNPNSDSESEYRIRRQNLNPESGFRTRIQNPDSKSGF